ncbi:MAG: asparaginase [Cyanobacteria bacterium NC_groundwater_1444_Ag_S-0.65um_54_12]|nr:asparaginase [Cyanobacteria bacterium NC_groundwater_1444_Ag_S-0.65um_54_12]
MTESEAVAWNGAVPLVEVCRGGRVESVHTGWWAIVTASGEKLDTSSGPLPEIYARSSAKPFQALPLLQSGAADAFGLVEEELAICCASHAGEAFHRAAVSSVLTKAGLGSEALRCGSHAPLGDPAAPPGVLENNCSGKHAGMLATCRHQGWPLASYLASEHSLQQAIRTELTKLADTALRWGVDGCGAPAWYLPLASLALAYARLPAVTPGERIIAAMAAHPRMVAGTDRRDTAIMLATSGRLVSKGGAEGVSAGCYPAKGIGWALKISDGNARAVGPALLALLLQFGLLTAAEYERLATWGTPLLKNHAGTVVGQLKPWL